MVNGAEKYTAKVLGIVAKLDGLHIPHPDAIDYRKGKREQVKKGTWLHQKGEANNPLLVYAEWEGEKNNGIWISEDEACPRRTHQKLHNNLEACLQTINPRQHFAV